MYTRTKQKNECNKNPTEENKALHKKQINNCVSLRPWTIKYMAYSMVYSIY